MKKTPRIFVLLVAFLPLVYSCDIEDADPGDNVYDEDLSFDPGTTEDREALFDYLVEKTMKRDAFASLQEHPVHREHPAGIDVIAEMEQHRDALINAETDEQMWHALRKLSNARRDRHLGLTPIENGLERPGHLDTEVQAPVSFKVDFGDPENRFFFVADLAEDIEDHVSGEVPSLGDRLVTIEGRTTEEHVEAMRPHKRYSTEEPLWWLIGDEITRTWDTYYGYAHHLPHDEFYGGEPDLLSLELERQDGTRYELEVPYKDPDELEWQGHTDREYPGFSPVDELSGYESYRNVYLSDNNDPVIIIDWFGFRGDVVESMDHLMDYAEENELLEYNVVVDATRSRGGSNGAYMLARIQSEQFKTTAHNLMVSDVSERWVRERLERWEEDPPEFSPGQNLVYEKEWLETDAMNAIEEGQYYTNDVPFKGVQPKWGDRFIEPADRHFTGELIVWLSPHGGSHLDQFASQVVDNDIGHIMGMATGGYSNSWSSSEVLRFPTNDKPIVEYEWSMGHSIRANGEILQYNPAEPHEYIPQTRENFFEYHTMLLERSFGRLGL